VSRRSRERLLLALGVLLGDLFLVAVALGGALHREAHRTGARLALGAVAALVVLAIVLGSWRLVRGRPWLLRWRLRVGAVLFLVVALVLFYRSGTRGLDLAAEVIFPGAFIVALIEGLPRTWRIALPELLLALFLLGVLTEAFEHAARVAGVFFVSLAFYLVDLESHLPRAADDA
jgi:hypothetical protein